MGGGGGPAGKAIRRASFLSIISQSSTASWLDRESAQTGLASTMMGTQVSAAAAAAAAAAAGAAGERGGPLVQASAQSLTASGKRIPRRTKTASSLLALRKAGSPTASGPANTADGSGSVLATQPSGGSLAGMVASAAASGTSFLGLQNLMMTGAKARRKSGQPQPSRFDPALLDPSNSGNFVAEGSCHRGRSSALNSSSAVQSNPLFAASVGTGDQEQEGSLSGPGSWVMGGVKVQVELPEEGAPAAEPSSTPSASLQGSEAAHQKLAGLVAEAAAAAAEVAAAFRAAPEGGSLAKKSRRPPSKSHTLSDLRRITAKGSAVSPSPTAAPRTATATGAAPADGLGQEGEVEVDSVGAELPAVTAIIAAAAAEAPSGAARLQGQQLTGMSQSQPPSTERAPLPSEVEPVSAREGADALTPTVPSSGPRLPGPLRTVTAPAAALLAAATAAAPAAVNGAAAAAGALGSLGNKVVGQATGSMSKLANQVAQAFSPGRSSGASKQAAASQSQLQLRGMSQAQVALPVVGPVSPPAVPPPPPPVLEDVERLLAAASTSWTFDSFALADATRGHPLSTLAYYLIVQGGWLERAGQGGDAL